MSQALTHTPSTHAHYVCTESRTRYLYRHIVHTGLLIPLGAHRVLQSTPQVKDAACSTHDPPRSQSFSSWASDQVSTGHLMEPRNQPLTYDITCHKQTNWACEAPSQECDWELQRQGCDLQALALALGPQRSHEGHVGHSGGSSYGQAEAQVQGKRQGRSPWGQME